MTVLVVGATGVLGGMVARALLERGERVRALVRQGTDAAALEAAGAEIARGDLKEPESIDPALRGVERVVTTATAAHRGGADTIEAVDRRGTAALIDAARRAGVGRFVYTSSAGFRADSPVDIARAKVENEERLAASGMPYTILHPARFMEVWIGYLVGGQIAAGDTVRVVGDPDVRCGFVATEEVAALAIAALKNPEAENAILPFCTDQASYREIVDLAAEATGRRITVEAVLPGESIAGLPPVAVELWRYLAPNEPLPVTEDVIEEYGIEPVTVRQFVRRAFAPQP